MAEDCILRNLVGTVSIFGMPLRLTLEHQDISQSVEKGTSCSLGCMRLLFWNFFRNAHQQKEYMAAQLANTYLETASTWSLTQSWAVQPRVDCIPRP